MNTPHQKRYHVQLMQPPVLTNDLGQMSETEVYKFVREKLDAIGAKNVMSQLEFNGTASAEFTTPLGLKALIEIIQV
jgi:hypothetical protein